MTTEERIACEAGSEAAATSAEEPPETVYRLKVIQFLGRQTSIVLQNDNGPCPLLAICNVLLLRNNLNLSLDTSEVSLQKLLSLVAGKLIDSNSNVEDDGYVNNQQQNIADAIELLPRLATGINDTDTAAAIGPNSYNNLVAELVAFEARNSGEDKVAQEEDFIDFAALGVPSPNLSRRRSFDDCQIPVSYEQTKRRGDIEEEEELKRALNLSRSEILAPDGVSASPVFDCTILSDNSDEHEQIHTDASMTQTAVESKYGCQSDKFVYQQESKENNHFKNNVSTDDAALLPSVITGNDAGIRENSGNLEAGIIADPVMLIYTTASQSPEEGSSGRYCSYEDLAIASKDIQSTTQISTKDFPSSQTVPNVANDLVTIIFSPPQPNTDSHSLNGETLLDVPGFITSSLGSTDSEPIYEGEECIVESGHSTYKKQEPVYEDEVILAEQANKREHDSHSTNTTDEVTRKKWQSVKNFLDHSASQLTFYGLFCLQEGLKEREFCVFFRNNHFSTMFKFNGELYILATDQGYISQPDLVWEKLNEVNGDTVFMTGNFTEFKAENQANGSWNEQSAMSATADYLAAFGSSSPSNSALNSDLQLAIALQQQEFEQQQQPQRQQQMPQPSPGIGRSRLVTGPEVGDPYLLFGNDINANNKMLTKRVQNPNVPQKSDSKAKDKCTVM